MEKPNIHSIGMTPYQIYQRDLRHLRDTKRPIALRHEAWRKFVSRYVFSHPDMGLREMASHLGISHSRIGEIARENGVHRGKA